MIPMTIMSSASVNHLFFRDPNLERERESFHIEEVTELSKLENAVKTSDIDDSRTYCIV
jgi:hypothetical protein